MNFRGWTLLVKNYDPFGGWHWTSVDPDGLPPRHPGTGRWWAFKLYRWPSAHVLAYSLPERRFADTRKQRRFQREFREDFREELMQTIHDLVVEWERYRHHEKRPKPPRRPRPPTDHSDLI